MSDKNKRSVVNSGGGGVFNEISNHFKLVFRLIRDPRVNPLLKLIPIGTLFYLVIPDLIIGPIDDAAIIGHGGNGAGNVRAVSVVVVRRGIARIEVPADDVVDVPIVVIVDFVVGDLAGVGPQIVCEVGVI